MFRFIRRKSKSYKDYKDLRNYEKIKSKSDGKTYFGTWFDGHLFLPPFEEYQIILFIYFLIMKMVIIVVFILVKIKNIKKVK